MFDRTLLLFYINLLSSKRPWYERRWSCCRRHNSSRKFILIKVCQTMNEYRYTRKTRHFIATWVKKNNSSWNLRMIIERFQLWKRLIVNPINSYKFSILETIFRKWRHHGIKLQRIIILNKIISLKIKHF